MMNPQSLMQMLQGSGNPMGMLQGFAGQNPQLKQAMEMLNGKNPQEMQQWVMNYAKENGQDINPILSQLGVNVNTENQ